MSELQSSLLIIGIFVVLAMYGYSWWRQRQYRRRFGAAFESGREDALYHQPAGKAADDMPGEPVADVLDEAQSLPEASPASSSLDEVCHLLGEATDYVVVLSFDTLVGADALAPLWQKRFDFGKSVNICGLGVASGGWERVVAESRLFYSAFRLALQLVDRSGPISEVRLSDFRDLARDIAAQLHAQTELPDVAQAVARAAQLDGFCVEVDQMTGLNIVRGGERRFAGAEVARAAAQYGMELQADGAFHLSDAEGHTVFSLGNSDGAPFQHHTLDQASSTGLTLLLDVPRVELPVQRFEQMAVLARQLAMSLHAAVVDDHRVALGESGFAQIRDQISAIESRMNAGGIAPGSAQARRLFS
jgi:FtsZ-interacting cell division protein ZipA